MISNKKLPSHDVYLKGDSEEVDFSTLLKWKPYKQLSKVYVDLDACLEDELKEVLNKYIEDVLNEFKSLIGSD